MKKSYFTAKRLAMNAIMTALYIGLSMFSFIIAGVKITIEGLPVVIGAIAFGPIDGILIGLLGEFVNQMLTFGLTPTTMLWVLPSVVRGLVIGLGMVGLKKVYTHENLFKGKGTPWIFVVCAISGILASCFNTLAYYVDSKMFGYYNYALVFGVFWVRLAVGIVTALAMATVSITITLALKKTKLIK